MTDEIRTDNTDTFKNALKKIVELTEENDQLKAQIEKMKCCGNCQHQYEGVYHNGFRCKDHASEEVCEGWELELCKSN